VKGSGRMLEKALDNIAEKILALDESSLSGLWNKYKDKMEEFETSKEWEKAVIIFFIINSVRVKNHIFNEQIMNRQDKEQDTKKSLEDIPPYLKIVK
jgi:predicted house-cleaning noncanonical NTP pyrophosphatase (MazG superfamily)